MKWKGPCKVVKCHSIYIFQITNMLTGETFLAHGRRLTFLRNKSYNVIQDLMDHLSYQQDELMVVDSFEDVRTQRGNVKIHKRWKGLSPEEDSWELVDALDEVVPVLLREYLQDLKISGTPRQRRIAANISILHLYLTHTCYEGTVATHAVTPLSRDKTHVKHRE